MRKFLILLVTLSPLFAGYSVDSLSTSFGTWNLTTHQADEGVEEKIKASLASRPGLQNLALAEVAYKNGQYDRARDYLYAAQNTEPSLTAVVQRRLGDLYLHLGQKGAALDAFGKASAATKIEGYKKYLDGRAQTLFAKYREEIQASGWNITFSIDTAKKPSVAPDTLKEAWVQRLSQGVTEPLVDSLMASSGVLGGKMATLLLLQDTSQISDSMPPMAMIKIAEEMYSLQLFKTANKWLKKVESRTSLDAAVMKRLGMLGARLSFDQSSWQEAISYAEKTMEISGDNPELLFLVARAYRKLADNEKANAYYLKHIQLFPSHPNSDDIMWYLGWEYEESSRYDSASLFYAQLANKKIFKNAPDAALRVGFVAFRQAKFAEALQTFKAFEASFPQSSLVPASYFWLARTYDAMDSTVQADSLYQSIISMNPLGYYAWRSLEQRGQTLDAPQKLTIITDNAWLGTLRRATQSRVDQMLSVAEQDQLTLVLFLGALGGYEQERDLFLKPLQKEVSKDLVNGYAMARILFQQENYQRSYWFARQVYYAVPQSERKKMSLPFMKLFFPEAYKKSVLDGAANAKIEPALVWGIMRQESTFHPTIKSPVGALGLMQIMPATGKMIADQLDTTFAVDMLLNTRVNIRFGSFYISQRLMQYNGKKELAIAAYNGGHHNVKKWIEKNQSVLEDPSFFTECIGFSETRDYVKKVLENYWMYQYIASLTKDDVYK